MCVCDSTNMASCISSLFAFLPSFMYTPPPSTSHKFKKNMVHKHFLENTGCVKLSPSRWQKPFHKILYIFSRVYIPTLRTHQEYTSACTCTYSKLHNVYILIGLMESSEKCVNTQLCEAQVQKHSSHTVCRCTHRGGVLQEWNSITSCSRRWTWRGISISSNVYTYCKHLHLNTHKPIDIPLIQMYVT